MTDSTGRNPGTYGLVITIRSLSLIARFNRVVVPMAKRELHRWRATACELCPDPVRLQAQASIEHKAFHSIGGSFYAVCDPDQRKRLVTAIVAYQTISDYLDNLCDRIGILDPAAFSLAHRSMLDALDPNGSEPDCPLPDYLAGFARANGPGDDGGYLELLVRTCAGAISELPSYHIVLPATRALARLYCDMQSLKHVEPQHRVPGLKRWFEAEYPEAMSAAGCSEGQWPSLTWYEFAAAAGSTLGIFALWALAANPRISAGDATSCVRAYFPMICGSHIMFDYLIDQEEDAREGDLNFVSHYPDRSTMASRLHLMYEQALTQALSLPRPHFHVAAVAGLAALYLSDPKTRTLQAKEIAAGLLRLSGHTGTVSHRVCMELRRAGALNVRACD